MEKKELIHRLNRIQGQIEAVRRMLESEETDCKKTIELVKASSNALKKFAQAYMESHIEDCLAENRKVKDIKKDLKEVVAASFTL